MDMQTAYAGYGARKVWHKEDRMRLSLPLYSLGEEIFSAVSHGVGALFGAAALVMLLWFCEKSLVNVVSVSIFGGTMILLYTVSTLYHALNVNRAKKVFRVLDHCTSRCAALRAGRASLCSRPCGLRRCWALF